jgi:hypothetical protein
VLSVLKHPSEDCFQRRVKMGSNLVIFLTYATMLVDGNPVTDVLSIGGKISETVLDPRPPAVIGGT